MSLRDHHLKELLCSHSLALFFSLRLIRCVLRIPHWWNNPLFQTIILEDVECSPYSILLLVITSSHEHWRTDLAQSIDIRALNWVLRHSMLVTSGFLLWLLVLILANPELIITPKQSLESRVFRHVQIVLTLIQWSHWSSKVTVRVFFSTALYTALFRWNFLIVH